MPAAGHEHDNQAPKRLRPQRTGRKEGLFKAKAIKDEEEEGEGYSEAVVAGLFDPKLGLF